MNSNETIDAVKDLVSRLPNFKSVQLLSDVLANSHHPLSQEKIDEILTFLAKAFVTDNKITISIAGAFRRVLLEIVRRACDIKSFPIEAQDRMDRIKQTIIALSVCIPIASQIIPIATKFVSKAARDSLSEARSDPHVSKALLRILSAHPEAFRELLDYSKLVECLKLPLRAVSPTPTTKTTISAGGVNLALLQGASKLPRHSSMVAATVSTVMNMNDTERVKMEMLSYRRSRSDNAEDKESEEYEACLVQAQRIGMDATLEIERTMALTLSRNPKTTDPTSQSFHTNKNVVSVGGILHERLRNEDDDSSSSSSSTNLDRRPFLLTKSIRTQIADLSAALTCPDRPILLVGPPGCGKTALLRHVASQMGQRGKMIELHLDDSCDAKSLIGSYVCDEEPGKFKWQPGVLTKAVNEGLWIVIEDIDSASNELLTAILPLLESRRLPLSEGHMDSANRVHSSFRLLATSMSASNRAGPNASIISNLFSRVTVKPLQDDELLNVLNLRCPGLGQSLLRQMLETYRSISTFCKLATLRDLMRWCARVNQSSLVDMSHAKRRRDLASKRKRDADLRNSSIVEQKEDEEEKEYFTDLERVSVLVEAFDVFACPLSRREERERLVVHLANMWGLDPELTQKRLMCGKPELALTENSMQIGRVQLTRSIAKEQKIEGFEMPAFTLRLMERLAVCVSQNDPVLLVGETGVGKTTIIQKLAEHIGARLVVQNLNVQSEVGDLLGSIKPLRMRQLARAVYVVGASLFLSFSFPLSLSLSLYTHTHTHTHTTLKTLIHTHPQSTYPPTLPHKTDMMSS